LHIEHILDFMDVGLIGQICLFFQKNKGQQCQYNLIVFLLGSVRVANSVKLKCYIHRCRTEALK